MKNPLTKISTESSTLTLTTGNKYYKLQTIKTDENCINFSYLKPEKPDQTHPLPLTLLHFAQTLFMKYDARRISYRCFLILSNSGYFPMV